MIKMPGPDSLAKLAVRGTDDRLWYSRARQELQKVADHFNSPYATVAGLAAVLSPRVSVRRSMRLLGQYLRGQQWPADVYAAKRDAVSAWASQGRLSGQKVRAFYDNLMGHEHSVVLDTWMAKAMLTPRRPWPSTGGPLVDKATIRIQTVARMLGWTPAQVQAAIWSATYRAHRGGASPPAITAQDALEQVHAKS